MLVFGGVLHFTKLKTISTVYFRVPILGEPHWLALKHVNLTIGFSTAPLDGFSPRTDRCRCFTYFPIFFPPGNDHVQLYPTKRDVWKIIDSKVTFDGCDGICDRSQEGTPSACKNALLWLAHFVQPIMDLQGHPPPLSPCHPHLSDAKKPRRGGSKEVQSSWLWSPVAIRSRYVFLQLLWFKGSYSIFVWEKNMFQHPEKRKGSYFHVYLEIRVILQIVVCV